MHFSINEMHFYNNPRKYSKTFTLQHTGCIKLDIKQTLRAFQLFSTVTKTANNENDVGRYNELRLYKNVCNKMALDCTTVCS